MLICPKFIFLTMLSKILSIIALTWNTGPCHLSQVQKWIRVQLCSISSVQSHSCVLIFTTSWTEARQASLSIINSQSLPRLNVHQVSDAIQPSHPLSSPSPPAFSLSQHQGLFQWVSSSHQVVKVLELQHQSLTSYLRRHLVHWKSGVTTEPCHLFQRMSS